MYLQRLLDLVLFLAEVLKQTHIAEYSITFYEYSRYIKAYRQYYYYQRYKLQSDVPSPLALEGQRTPAKSAP